MKISVFCQIRVGSPFPKHDVEREAADFFMVDSTAISASGKLVSDKLIPISSSKFSMPKVPLEEGDVLFGAKGNRNKTVIFEQPVEKKHVFATSNFLVLKILNNDLIMPAFLAWYLNQSFVKKQLSRIASGGTIRHITKKSLLGLSIKVPPISKQQLLLKLNVMTKEETQLVSEIRSMELEYYQSINQRFLFGNEYE